MKTKREKNTLSVTSPEKELDHQKEKDHHCTIRVMVVTSSHMCVSSSYGGEYPGEGYMALEQIFVSARTNKRHHHHQSEVSLRDVQVSGNVRKGVFLAGGVVKTLFPPTKKNNNNKEIFSFNTNEKE